MAKDTPPDSAGPSSPPPPLPEGWLAQWEGISRRWYYVQRATGKSQWEIPTEPVILTPSTTPTSTGTGPSKAPFSRPPTNSPQMGSEPGGMAADGNYTGADRAGFSSFFGSQSNPQQGSLTQMATGMLGRISNQFHDKLGGQAHGLLGHFSHHQNNQQQNPFGYLSTGQSGPYTGTAPQYHPPGQVPMVQGIVSHSQAGSTDGLIGGPQQSGPGLSQQFGVDTHGSLSSQFTQPTPATRMTPPGLSNPTQGDGTGTGTTLGPMGSTFPSASQPQWQLGQQPPIPLGTKPQISQPGVGSVNSQLAGQSLNGYTQQQPNLPLPQQSLASQHPSQYSNLAVTSAPLQTQQYPTTQAPDGFGGQSGIAKSFSSHSVNLTGHSAPSQGTQDTLRGIHTSESLLQQGMNQPVQPQGQYGPPTFGQQGHAPYQSAYGNNPLYQSFPPGQQIPGGSFSAAEQNFSGPQSSLASFSAQSSMPAGQFGLHTPPGNPQISQFNQQGSSLGNHFGPHPQPGFPQGKFGASGFAMDNQATPSTYQGASNDQMNQFRSISTQQGVLGNAPGAFQQPPHQTYPNPSQWPGPNSVHSRPTASDPQFVSGPWTATPGLNAGFPQASYYGGYAVSGR